MASVVTQKKIDSDLLSTELGSHVVVYAMDGVSVTVEADVTQEVLQAAIDAHVAPDLEGNERTLLDKAIAALATNNADIAQDQTIVTQADALKATTGTRTTAQLSGDVRALAQAVSNLAKNDIAAKKELNALIRLATRQLDSTSGA